MKKPLILDIKGNSLDDGPGIRSVVFFKGCPLSCVWCHNPESIKPSVEISFDPAECIDCGQCREICPENALSAQNPGYIDRKRCTLCFECVDPCPSGALEKVGTGMTVEDILSRVMPDKPFFDTSGGGVTLSGGEPALYMPFTSELLKAFKENGVHTLIETCGQFDRGSFMDMIYPYVDMIYYDIKIIDSDEHKRYCGTGNEKILSNFTEIHRTAEGDKKTVLPRTPLIPGITDTDKNIRGIAEFLKKQNIRKAALLEYNPLWRDKCEKVGIDDPFADNTLMDSFADRSELKRAESIFAENGIETE